MPQDTAMNLSYGDLIIVEIALVSYCKDLDLSMQSGQYISALLGKVEYQLSALSTAASHQRGAPLSPNLGTPPPAAPPK